MVLLTGAPQRAVIKEQGEHKAERPRPSRKLLQWCWPELAATQTRKTDVL